MTLHNTTVGDLVAVVCWFRWLLASLQSWSFRCSVI